MQFLRDMESDFTACNEASAALVLLERGLKMMRSIAIVDMKSWGIDNAERSDIAVWLQRLCENLFALDRTEGVISEASRLETVKLLEANADLSAVVYPKGLPKRKESEPCEALDGKMIEMQTEIMDLLAELILDLDRADEDAPKPSDVYARLGHVLEVNVPFLVKAYGLVYEGVRNSVDKETESVVAAILSDLRDDALSPEDEHEPDSEKYAPSSEEGGSSEEPKATPKSGDKRAREDSEAGGKRKKGKLAK